MLACEHGHVDIVRSSAAGAPWCAPPPSAPPTRPCPAPPPRRHHRDPTPPDDPRVSRTPFPLPRAGSADNEGHCAGEWATAGGHPSSPPRSSTTPSRRELVLGVVGRRDREPDLSYLSHPVRYDGDDKLLDTENVQLDDGLRSKLMRRHAAGGARPAATS